MSTTTVEYKDTHRVKICDLLSKIHVNKSKKEIRKEATQLINSTIILKKKKISTEILRNHQKNFSPPA